MTEQETKRIIAIISTAYTNYKPENMRQTVDLWQDMMSEYTYNQVSVALKAYIMSDTTGFAPTIGQLAEKIRMTSTKRYLTEMEAWTLVRKALSNGIYHAEEEFDKLPPMVQEAVGNPATLRAWAQTDADVIENVVQSNFMRTYRAIVARYSQIDRMPSDVKSRIEEMNRDVFPRIEHKDDTPKIEQTWQPMSDKSKTALEELKTKLG